MKLARMLEVARQAHEELRGGPAEVALVLSEDKCEARTKSALWVYRAHAPTPEIAAEELVRVLRNATEELAASCEERAAEDLERIKQLRSLLNERNP